MALALTSIDTDEVMKLVDPEEINKRLKSTGRMQLAACLNLHADLFHLLEMVDEDNVTNGRKKKTGGNKERERNVDNKLLINPWAFHTAREQAIRTNVNDQGHSDYNKDHDYFGKSAIGRRPKDVSPDDWENNSIMPLMQQKFAENKEQIILDMINEKDIFTSDTKDPKTYWSKKSTDAKNDYIKKIKGKYPKNELIQALQPIQAPQPVNDEIRVDPSQAPPKTEIQNDAKAIRQTRRRQRADDDTREEDPKAPRTETPTRRRTRANAAKNPIDDNVTAESSEREQPGSTESVPDNEPEPVPEEQFNADAYAAEEELFA